MKHKRSSWVGGASEWVKRGLWGLAWLFTSLACSWARADDLTYSKLDESTVRVFSFKSVEVTNVKSITGRSYALGTPDAGHGSGLIINKDGLILTARHVVEDARLVAVLLPGRDRPLPAEVVYTDKEHDTAFVTVLADTPSYLELPSQKPKLSVREVVYVVGYPLDASRARPQSEQGIVSGVLPDGSLQLGIALNPGNSGGPVVDAKERFIGIAVARADPRAGAQGIGVAVPVEHILPAYAKVQKSAELASARSRLGKRGSRGQDEAELLAALLTADDSSSAGEALGGKKEASPRSKSVDKWLAELDKSGATSADLLALEAAQEWNAAAVLEERHQSAGSSLENARNLIKRAVAADDALAKRSPFAAFVLEGKEPHAQSDGEGSGGENDSEAQEAARRRFLESVVTKKEQPPIRIGPTVAINAPFQVLGFGATGKFMIAKRWSVNARYLLGYHFNGGEATTTLRHFGEATVGYAIGNWQSETEARLVVDIERHVGLTILHYVPAKIPSVHTLVLEGGAMTGSVNLQTISPPLTYSQPVNQQIFIPEVGLRYMYFFSAESEYMVGRQRGGVDVALHALGPIFNVPSNATDSNGKAVHAASLGAVANVGWQAASSWGHSEFGLGYLPHGDWVILRIGWSYLFY